MNCNENANHKCACGTEIFEENQGNGEREKFRQKLGDESGGG